MAKLPTKMKKFRVADFMRDYELTAEEFANVIGKSRASIYLMVKNEKVNKDIFDILFKFAPDYEDYLVRDENG